jgi:ECF sigma factor
MNDVTHILSAIERGDPKAADQLLPLIYDELRPRFFAGLTALQAAAALGVSTCTALKDWAYARSWLRVAAIDRRSGHRP